MRCEGICGTSRVREALETHRDLAIRRGADGRGPAIEPRRGSLDLDRRAGVFELLLELLGVLLGDAGLDHLGGRLDQVLGLLEAEAGRGADDLDDVDLVAPKAFRSTSNSVFGGGGLGRGGGGGGPAAARRRRPA